MHRRVETPRGPKYRGVETPRCPTYVPGSRESSVLCEAKLPGVLCTGESFFVSLNLQAHAAAFKATLIQKTVLF